MCRGPLHNLGQQLLVKTYGQKQSLLIYSERGYNNETMSRHKGLFNSQQYIQKTNYYACRNALFITEGYITDLLKTTLTEDMWMIMSTDLASWLPRWCNLMKVACWIYIVGSLQVLVCLNKSRNSREKLSRAGKQSLVTLGLFCLTTAWPLLTTASSDESNWANRIRSMSTSFSTCPCGSICLKTPAI